MKSVVIDANALVSFVTDRNLEQQTLAAPIFEAAAAARLKVFCPHNVLTEFVYVMNRVYKIKNAEVAAVMRDLTALPGLHPISNIDFDILFSLWPDPIEEYGDAIVATVAKAAGATPIATFDLKFRKILKKLNMPLYEWGQIIA